MLYNKAIEEGTLISDEARNGVARDAGESASIVGSPFTRETIEQTVAARFQQVAVCYRGRTALTGDGRSWTYEALNRRANRIAHAVQANAGPDRGCVAMLVKQTPEMVISTLAVLKSSRTHLGVHPDMPSAAQREILHDAAPGLLLATETLAHQAREIAEGICPVLVLDGVDERFPDDDPELSCRPGDPAIIFYTSGSTGKPKGVAKNHRAVMHRVWLSTQHDFIVPEDRQSLLTHCAYSAAEADMFGALLQGATLCVHDISLGGLSVFRTWIDEEQITLLHPPVALFRSLLDTLDGSGLFPSVRTVALAGDVVLPSDLARWRRHFSASCTLLHRFSTTETALLTVASFDRYSDLDAEFVDAGHPVADKSITLIDDSGRPVGLGKAGELVVRSRYLSMGYWRRPKETARVFEPAADDPGVTTYRTGDLARFLPDGSLVFVRRQSHLAKIRGFRVDTREIESRILALQDVSAVAVIVDRQHDKDRLRAFVVTKSDAPFDARQMRKQLRAHLPEWKIPSLYDCLDALPTTLNGKVDRQSLIRIASGKNVVGDARVNEQPAPASAEIEQELAKIWQVTLSVKDVGRDDDFQDLGGNSISAAATMTEIERRYGIHLTMATLIQHPTIGSLGGWLLENLDGARQSVRPAPSRSAPVDNVADAFLELLNRQGVDYIFANPGTDNAPVLESLAKFKAKGIHTPELILCLHESIALSAAHGYFMVTGKPQVVMVHVDVGTQNLGANLHNAQRGRAGVVICAGRAPYTVGAGSPGGRDRYNQWTQEQYHQAGIVQAYVKWHYELAHAATLTLAVERAFRMAGAEPQGPVYLTLPREILMQPTDAGSPEPGVQPFASRPFADPATLERAAQWLIEAECPLILTAYCGRNPDAVSALIRLAETLAAPVIETRHRLNFPSDHPLHLGHAPPAYLNRCDCVLVIDHDVPWVPGQYQPEVGTRVIHLDTDPLKRDFPIWGFQVDMSIHGDSALVCESLANEAERQLAPSNHERLELRRRRVAAEHGEYLSRAEQRALGLADHRPIAIEWAAHCMNGIVDEDTLVVAEAVSSSPALWRHLRLNIPGSCFQSMGSGLGWGLGAALGAALAAPSKTVVCITGDGARLFSAPIAAYWAAEQHRKPFLTVVLNNQEYYAVTEALLRLAPRGYARRSGNYPACDLPEAQLLARIAGALGLWTRTVDDPAKLAAELAEALTQVRNGRSALVNICIDSSRPVEPSSTYHDR